MFVNGSKRNERLSIEDLPYMHPTKFLIIWPSGFRGKAVLEIDQ